MDKPKIKLSELSDLYDIENDSHQEEKENTSPTFDEYSQQYDDSSYEEVKEGEWVEW